MDIKSKETIKEQKAVNHIASEKVTDVFHFNLFNEGVKGDSILNMSLMSITKLKNAEYKLEVKANSNVNIKKLKSNYYILVSLYPYDKELDIMPKERRKYGFEAFSCKIRSVKDKEVVISRLMKTKLVKIRAIVISVLKYEDKTKCQEIVLENVNFD